MDVDASEHCETALHVIVTFNVCMVILIPLWRNKITGETGETCGTGEYKIEEETV